MNKTTNNTRLDIIRNSFKAAFGLFMFGFGVYLTIQANIGVGPWDVLNLGLSGTFGIKFGTGSIIISLLILAIDIFLREPIGIGMFLDAFVVGKTVDLFNWMDVVKPQDNPVLGIVMMLAGLFIMGYSQYLYMDAALGCGPRDTLLVALAKRMPKIPIGVISIVILAVVTFIGWRLGGPIGIGTIICAFFTGPIMQLDFKLVGFDATKIVHQNIKESAKIFINKKS